MDAVELLTADHQRARGLFRRFEQARAAGDDHATAALAATIAEELTVHTTIEEERFYPACRAADETLASLLDESLQEHHVVAVLLDELAQVPAGSAEWVAKLTVLIENVEHHAEEEEQELFPKVRRAIDEAGRAALGASLDERKGELGAPTAADREHLSNDDVRRLASAQDIPGRSKMSPEQLRAAVDPR